ncbi:MAG: cation transporting ATPase C-terminal domain-containing protein [Syntrophobacteraceae bacterium]|nr:cation transporting ATPase C-terminal domain-containing protein [Syntrophobacteraceae bacterium]
MTTAGALGLMLAFEPRERGIMRRPPRDPRGALLSRRLLSRMLLMGLWLMAASFGLFEWMEWSGASHGQARTVAVNSFAVISTLYLLNTRSLERSYWSVGVLSNPWIPLGIVSMVLLQLAFTYVPFMNRMFRSEPISLEAWAAIVGAAVLAHFLVGLEKFIARRLSTRRGGSARTLSEGEEDLTHGNSQAGPAGS